MLILVGVFALLVNTGQLSADRVFELVNLWPVILIVIGLELIVRRSVHGPAGDLAAAVIVLLAVVGAAVYVTVTPVPATTGTLDASSEVGGVTEASAEIDAGAATVNVAAGANLGANLYHAHIEYAGPKPEVRLDPSGRLKIDQPNNGFLTFQNHRFALNLDLNPSIPWRITLNSGATTSTINVPHLHLTGLTLNTGASRNEITLGSASGIVPVTVNGGSLTVHIHRPSGTNASVQVSGGAVSLDADGKSMHSIGNVNYETSGFSGAADGYRLRVNGGSCTVTLDTATESA